MQCKRRSTLALGAVMLPLFAAAAPPAPANVFPPPGLYRIDTDSDLKIGNALGQVMSNRITQDSKSTTVQGKRADGSSAAAQSVAGAPNTTCIKPSAPNRTLPPTAGCKGAPGVAGPGSMTFNQTCGGVQLSTVVRKLDDKTWEYRTRSVERGPAAVAGGQPNYAAMRVMLEQQAKSGTPAERAQATKMLAQLGPYEAQMKQNAALLAAGPQAAAHVDEARRDGVATGSDAGAPARETTTVQRLTRIADSCQQR